jgi:hypothetical protein
VIGCQVDVPGGSTEEDAEDPCGGPTSEILSEGTVSEICSLTTVIPWDELDAFHAFSDYGFHPQYAFHERAFHPWVPWKKWFHPWGPLFLLFGRQPDSLCMPQAPADAALGEENDSPPPSHLVVVPTLAPLVTPGSSGTDDMEIEVRHVQFLKKRDRNFLVHPLRTHTSPYTSSLLYEPHS